ncbi:MFS transporter [Streptomyces mirabilis]|uniref:MFS transporter n=1 Tax=Streptomyces mirabilis TaxID=68239 RepID=UPI00367ABE99
MSAVRRMDTALRRGDCPQGVDGILDATDTGIRIHVSVPGEALLPVIAGEHLYQGSGGYGLLLAVLGAGAVGGALGMERLRNALTANQLLLFSGLLYGCGVLVTALSASLPVVAAVSVATGAGWLVTLSTLNTSMQLTLSAWVRARKGTLVPAASLLVVGAASLSLLPLLPDTGRVDRIVSAHWPEPALVFDTVGDTGPVLAEIAYEVFEVPTWDEHLRQHHERTTGFDQQVLDRVRALSRTEPRSRHLLPARSAAARG